ADATLLQVAALLEAQLPADALVARLACDQFCVALPETAASAALATAEDLRKAVEDAHWPTGPLTLSAGVVDVATPTALDSNTLLARARHALQQARGDGRNRVHGFDGWQLRA
ncbi:diguanylate cyclase, partial [Xanthomonas perforans]